MMIVAGVLLVIVAGAAHHKASHRSCEPQQWPRCLERPIYLWHIHKAAGTTVCAIVRKNGLCTPVAKVGADASSFFGKNCNPSRVDATEALWGDPIAYARRERVDMWANEWYLPYELPSRAHLIAVAREPVARVFSHCGSAKALPQLAACATEPRMINFATTRLVFCAMFRASCRGRFLGLDPFREKNDDVVSSLNSTAALEMAKERLELFDTILIVERFGEAGRVLEATFGWSDVDADANRRGTHQRTAQHLEANAHLVARLRYLNHNDLMLYEHANHIFTSRLSTLEKKRRSRRCGR